MDLIAGIKYVHLLTDNSLVKVLSWAAVARVDDVIPLNACRKPPISPPIATDNNNTAALN